MASVEMSSSYGWVVIVVVLKFILNTWMGFEVGNARRRYKVPYPTMYAIESENKDAKLFNCVQRAHQNCLEFMPQFFVLLLLGGLQFPRVATILGLSYLVFRYFYFKDYSTGVPDKRLRIGIYHFFSLLGLAVCTSIFAVHLLTSS